MKANQIKITQPFITQPNEIGEIIRETSNMIIVRVLKRTFESKTSANGNIYTFTEDDKEWFGDGLNIMRRFWKKNGSEVGGKTFIKKSI